MDLPDPLVAAIEDRCRTKGTFGCAVTAFDRDGVRFTGGVGYADLATSRRVTPSTTFRVGSISKLLTTTLILRLVDRGDIDLDRGVNAYLPSDLQIDAPASVAAGPTIRSLLSHSSGLPPGVRGVDVGNRLLTYAGNRGRVENLRDAIAGLAVEYDPDTRVVYSNPAFNVLGVVAEEIGGNSFERMVDEEVLTPLGMTSSQFCTDRSGPDVATHYGGIVPPSAGSAPVDGFRLVATPMGGLTTSVADLARFGQMMLRSGAGAASRVLDETTARRATSLRVTNHPRLDQGYGLGWKVRPWRGRTMVGHDGNMPGVASQMALSPDDGVGVAVLTNGYSLSVPHEIAELALERMVGLERAPVATATDNAYRAALFGRSVAGVYRLRDTSPPGLIGRLNDATVRVRVVHESEGRLRVEGNPGSDGPIWLVPQESTGEYRVAGGVDNGTSGVIERHDDGTHLWFGFAQHLVSN